MWHEHEKANLHFASCMDWHKQPPGRLFQKQVPTTSLEAWSGQGSTHVHLAKRLWLLYGVVVSQMKTGLSHDGGGIHPGAVEKKHQMVVFFSKPSVLPWVLNWNIQKGLWNRREKTSSRAQKATLLSGFWPTLPNPQASDALKHTDGVKPMKAPSCTCQEQQRLKPKEDKESDEKPGSECEENDGSKGLEPGSTNQSTSQSSSQLVN